MATSADLFKKFTLENVAQIASSSHKEQKEVREELAEQYPALREHWEEILPKKSDIFIIRCQGQVHCITLVSSQPEVLFFNHHGGPYMPHLRLLHKYPFMLKGHQMDIGGCRHVISGANVMCQGLTSAGGVVADDTEEGEVVGVYVEGKAHAVAVGVMLISSEEIKERNRGPCIENVHHLGDGLWMNPILSASHISV
ncbi:putative Pre-PUA-like domain/PUA domain containing protein [Leishmania naiffi]|uniref:Pre-PUA-like domain/PUA domain containing protein n=1 Tax=Leishmania naiffi TaxID=5678 RepID=A0AAW3BWK1_9TRYP